MSHEAAPPAGGDTGPHAGDAGSIESPPGYPAAGSPTQQPDSAVTNTLADDAVTVPVAGGIGASASLEADALTAAPEPPGDGAPAPALVPAPRPADDTGTPSPGTAVAPPPGTDVTEPVVHTGQEMPVVPPPRRRHRAVRVLVLVVLIVVGVAGVGVGGTLLGRELTRQPTSAEKAAAVQAESDSRWQRLPAGKIFTPTLGYGSSDAGADYTATLVGIAQQASCRSALDPAMATLMVRYGCVTVLRATYLDYSGTLVVTVAIVVMRDVTGASHVSVQPPPAASGVRTLSLPGTVAAQFGAAQRLYFSALSRTGSYVFLAVAGYADGRDVGSASTTPQLADLTDGVISGLQFVLTKHGSACSMKDIRC